MIVFLSTNLWNCTRDVIDTTNNGDTTITKSILNIEASEQDKSVLA